MPSKLYDSAKPTFYLDTSTLCDAFRTLNDPARPSDPAYRPLQQWVERVAGEANLCLSLIHVSELAKWPDIRTANAAATWLDGLPVVWMHSTMTLNEQEDDVWTRRAAGVISPNVEPFAPSLLSAFHGGVSAKAAAELHASSQPIVALLETARLIAPRYEDAPTEAATSFRADRAAGAARGWSEERGREQVEYNMRVELRTRAMEADQRITRREDPAYAAKPCTGGAVQDRLVELYKRDPQALPLFRLAMLFNDGFVAGVMRRQPGSAKDRDALSGSFHDGLHLAGAAYCDVFTCDRATSNSLGGFRAQMRLRPQLAVRGHTGGVQGFVTELMATWP